VAAMIIGLSYKLFDFTLFVTVGVIVLILAATLSFVKINGRPFHLFILNIIQTLRRPSLRVWNNQSVVDEQTEKTIVVPAANQPAPPKIYKASHLAELALIVDTKGRYKGE